MANEKFNFTRNVVYDIIPGKIFNAFIGVWNFEALKESFNCFVPRVDKSKRAIFSFTRKDGKMARIKTTYPEFVKLSKGKGSSFTGDPKMKKVPKFLKFTSEPFTKPGPMAAPGRNYPEIRLLSNTFSAVELGADKKKGYTPWDFRGFFATESRCVKLKIGPDAKLFVNGVAN